MEITALGSIVRNCLCKCASHSTANLLLVCCAATFAANPTMAATPVPQDSQQPSPAPQAAVAPSPSAEAAPDSQDSRAVGTLPEPPGSKAIIYVYREGHMVGAVGHPLLFANDNFLAVLKNSNYAKLEVPPGMVVIAATFAEQDTMSNSDYRSLDQYYPPTLRWPNCVVVSRKLSCTWAAAVQTPEKKEELGCAKVDWRGLDTARPADLGVCRMELSTTSAALDNWIDPHRKSKELFLGMLLPTPLGSGLLMDAFSGPKGDLSPWLQVCGPNPFPQRSSEEVDKIRGDRKRGDNSDDWSRCKNGVAAAELRLQVKERLRIAAEAGRAYYVRWSVTGKGGKMELMDEAKGAKEMHKLHPVKD